jgi:hypothetical protein
MEISDFKPTLPIIILTVLLFLVFGFLNNYASFMQLTGLTSYMTGCLVFGAPVNFLNYCLAQDVLSEWEINYTGLIADIAICYVIGAFIAFGIKGKLPSFVKPYKH